VASFDDDSYPLDPDFFARLLELARKFPEAAVFTAAVFHPGETIEAAPPTCRWVADFSGGACVYRRHWFGRTAGYVPLPLAYGMEETDLALRLHAVGGRILHCNQLRVFHDNDRTGHAAAHITAASIGNLALLTYLRFPPAMWPVGAIQILRRLLWLQRHRRRRGILAGIAMTPFHLWRHRAYRAPVAPAALRSYFRLRRAPLPAQAQAAPAL
jgi:GT2 family glycosyltransferase